MENLFEKVTDGELKKYYEQFQDWERTGVISGNELGEMRDAFLKNWAYVGILLVYWIC